MNLKKSSRLETHKFILITLGLTISLQHAQAFDSRKCNKILNEGAWKKYKYLGVGEGQSSATSQGTRREGSTKVSMESETERLTSSVDPGITTKHFLSSTQYSTSFGECDSFALNKITEERHHFAKMNSDLLKQEIAQGRGDFLDVLAYYSLCDDQASSQMGEKLQKRFLQIVDLSKERLPTVLDQMIAEDLGPSCLTSI